MCRLKSWWKKIVYRAVIEVENFSIAWCDYANRKVFPPHQISNKSKFSNIFYIVIAYLQLFSHLFHHKRLWGIIHKNFKWAKKCGSSLVRMKTTNWKFSAHSTEQLYKVSWHLCTQNFQPHIVFKWESVSKIKSQILLFSKSIKSF